VEGTARPSAKVLVVEDDTTLAMAVERVVAELGYEPVVCVRGEDAVAQARALRPELILMDVKLKGELTGIDAAEIIKGEELGSAIVFMTAYGDPEYAKRMRQIAGCNVMGKPLSEPMLRLVVREKLGLVGRYVERLPRRPVTLLGS
jgi:CheY-like chemotaxis protein